MEDRRPARCVPKSCRQAGGEEEEEEEEGGERPDYLHSQDFELSLKPFLRSLLSSRAFLSQELALASGGCGPPRGRAAGRQTHVHKRAPPPRPLGQQKLPRRTPRSSAPPLRAAPAELQPARPAATACAQPGVPWPPQPGRALRRAACRPRPPAQQPHLPCSYPSSGIGCPLSAAGRRLRSPPRLQPPARTPDFKNKQAPPPPRDARRISASSRLPRPGSLLAGPGRDARAVTPRSRHRSLGAPRARGVRLAIALPPSVSPPSPAMQCQDCTALTHRLSSQLEKKKRERARGNSEGGGLSGVLQRIAQLGAGSAERPAAGRRARHGGEQEPALPLHQHNCLGSASQPAGPAPPTSCDQIRPKKASLNLRRLPRLGISSRPHLHSQVSRHPPPVQAGAPDGFAGTIRPRGSFLSHQGQDETVTKCLETQRACQESMCVMLGRTQVAFFHKENSLVLDTEMGQKEILL
ncbi:serine/arginine repetitive matrix protein 1-like [Kogia breviceps]|uniref:serine/arginine repetitive matrix protein 1-like n=1 Tax=Kogia breviceps TaxID=27615 RepID=UPI0034D1DCDA